MIDDSAPCPRCRQESYLRDRDCIAADPPYSVEMNQHCARVTP